MRRISLLLALAALLLTAVVGFTYRSRTSQANAQSPARTPHIGTGQESVAQKWVYDKDDPQTNRPVVHVTAEAFEATHDPSTFALKGVTLRLYHKDAKAYTFVRTASADFDDRSKEMHSTGAVTIIMNVPAEKNAENPAEVANLVQVQTSGVTYQTNDGKAETNQAASFKFSEGSGQAKGVFYDPNTGDLHLKSAISLDWVGHGPAENKMHIEAGDLVYKEREQKIYLSPWSKLQRQGTSIQAGNALVTLQDGVLQKVDADHAIGSDIREDKRTDYSADHVTANFDDNGGMTNLLAQGKAHLVSASASSRTTVNAATADMRFTP